MADWVTMFTENHLTQSEHHAAQEQSSVSTLCHARTICEADSLEQECTNFPQARSDLKIVGTIRVTWSKFHTENQQILDATTENLVTAVTWHPGCVYPWVKR